VNDFEGAAGRKFIPSVFSGFADLPKIEQIALLVFAGGQRHPKIGGGTILLIQDLMKEIHSDPEWGLSMRSISSKAVPEQFTILRALQFAANYWKIF
jgi:hypothetical protein